MKIVVGYKNKEKESFINNISNIQLDTINFP